MALLHGVPKLIIFYISNKKPFRTKCNKDQVWIFYFTHHHLIPGNTVIDFQEVEIVESYKCLVTIIVYN